MLTLQMNSLMGCELELSIPMCVETDWSRDIMPCHGEKNQMTKTNACHMVIWPGTYAQLGKQHPKKYFVISSYS